MSGLRELNKLSRYCVPIIVLTGIVEDGSIARVGELDNQFRELLVKSEIIL